MSTTAKAVSKNHTTKATVLTPGTDKGTLPFVRDLMTRDVVTCQKSDSCLAAAHLMKQYDVGLLPVLDGPRVVGVITDRDLVIRHLAVGGTPSSHTRVEECMTRTVHAVGPDKKVDEAMMTMKVNSVRRLVVKEGEALVGILALDDILVRAGQSEALGRLVDDMMIQSTLRFWG